MANRKNPGPGQYNWSAIDKSPAFSISKSGRGTYEEKGKRPGPGQYPSKSTMGSKGVSIAGRVNSGSFMGKGNNTPGPGQYSNVYGNRPKTAGGTFGGRLGSSLAINPQT